MQIEIEKLIYGGAGLGRVNGKPVFVKKSLPGDLLEIKITKNKKSFSEGVVTKIIKSSPKRITSKCPYFENCGGCDYQNISYVDQLEYKSEIFTETLQRQGIETEILPIIPGSDSKYYYRNTIRFFSMNDGEQSFAMHQYDDFSKPIPIKSCLLQSEFCNELLHKLAPYAEGMMLRIREGKFIHEFMVEIITKNDHLPHKDEIIELLRKYPEIKSCYHTVAFDEKMLNARRKLLFGSPIIHEKIGKYTFQLSPESFFQTNSLGIKTLYDKIKEFAGIEMGDRVLDLYCGAGTIGIYLSTLAKEIVGVEIVQNAINDAKANAKINKIQNCEFICSDAGKWLQQYSSNSSEKSDPESSQQDSNHRNFDTIIVDPPRNGLDKTIILPLSKLLTLNSKLIYVSCNPTTFARDIVEFEKVGLKLKKVQPVDMFPQTHHIECVGLIEKG